MNITVERHTINTQRSAGTYKQSEIKINESEINENGKFSRFNKNDYSVMSCDSLKAGRYIYRMKGSKITARYMILAIN